MASRCDHVHTGCPSGMRTHKFLFIFAKVRTLLYLLFCRLGHEEVSVFEISMIYPVRSLAREKLNKAVWFFMQSWRMHFQQKFAANWKHDGTAFRELSFYDVWRKHIPLDTTLHLKTFLKWRILVMSWTL